MEEPTQQPSDNSIRQANSIETQAELDAAILAAVQRANEAHTVESPAEDASETQPFADDDAAETGFMLFDDFDDDAADEFDDDSALFGYLIAASYEEEQEDLSVQIPMAPPVEEVKLPQPQSDDAVLGGQNPTLASSVVLGGLEGVKRRLASTAVESKILALKEALKYGQAGLDLVVQALKNESKSVAQALYLQLRDSSNPLAQQVLQQFNPYQFFECTFSGSLESFRRGGVSAIAISPDGQTLVGGGMNGTIKLWNLHTGKWLRSITEDLNYVYSIAISPDGQTLASGGLGRSIKFWNLHTGEKLHTLEGHSSSVDFIAISPDGQTLVSGSEDGTIEIWNVPTGKQLHSLKGHSSGVGSIAISPDGQTLVSGGLGRRINLWQDQSIKLWNLHNGEPINILKGVTKKDELRSMKQVIPTNASPLCPSSTHPEQQGSVAFGVVGGTVESPRLAYLREPQPVTDELLAVSGSVAPTEVFRFAAPCAGSGCRHFDGTDCRLAQRIVSMLPTVVDVLPACQLRSNCRWWQQEGKAACLRCPQVVTKTYHSSEQLRQVATPTNKD